MILTWYDDSLWAFMKSWTSMVRVSAMSLLPAGVYCNREFRAGAPWAARPGPFTLDVV
jgi:hypothetical protein